MTLVRAMIGLFFELIVLPYLLGVKYMELMGKKEKNGCFVYGYCIIFSLFYITIMPFIYLRWTLRIASLVWLVETVVLAIILFASDRNVINKAKEIIAEMRANFDRGKKIVIFLWIAIGMIAVFFVHSVTSDETVVTSIMAYTTDTMYVYDPYTREIYWELPIFAKSPIAIYYAVISKITTLSPSLVIKYVIPVLLMVLCYQVYSLLSSKLFDNANKRYLFQIVVIMSYFGMLFFKEENSMNILQNVWNGKSILWNILIPFTLYLGINYLEDNVKGKKHLATILNFVVLMLTSVLLVVDGAFYILSIAIVCGIVRIIRWGIRYADNRKYGNDDICD